jgi:hypothetical protein
VNDAVVTLKDFPRVAGKATDRIIETMEASKLVSQKRSRRRNEVESPTSKRQRGDTKSSAPSVPPAPQVAAHSNPHNRPLKGMVLSISTLASNNCDSCQDSSNTSYNEMVKACIDLGATVSNQVCKRMNVLVCTKAAVEGSTQRVRKAIKKNKPVVSVAWIEACRSEGRKLDYDSFRLYGEAGDEIDARPKRSVAEGQTESLDKEMLHDHGWTEPVNLG